MAGIAKIEGEMTLFYAGGKPSCVELSFFTREKRLLMQCNIPREAFLAALCQHGDASCYITMWPQEMNNE